MSELIGWHINMRNTLKQDIPTYYSLSEGNISSHIVCASNFKTGMSLKQSMGQVYYTEARLNQSITFTFKLKVALN